MALNNFANLKASIRVWSERDDIEDVIDDIILLAEQEMYNNAEEILLVRQMEVETNPSTSTSVRTLALPTGFIEMREMKIEDDEDFFTVVYKTPEQLQIIDRVGLPQFFTVTDQIEFDRVSDVAYTLQLKHYAEPTALSDSNTTNSILTNYPAIYLDGCLWRTLMFGHEAELAENAYRSFIRRIKGANRNSKKGRFGPSPGISNKEWKP